MTQEHEIQLSIIIPVYNAEKYLLKCVESIVNSTYHSIEVILVDDGSTDKSSVLCEEFSQLYQNVRTFHKPNGGLISARMYGVEHAKSQWITFVDADDWIDEDFIEKMTEPIKGNEAIDIVVGSFVSDYDGFIKENFGKEKEMWLSKDEALLIMFQRRLYNWSGCAKLYKKEMIMKMEAWWYDVDYGEDTEMNWKLFSMSKKIYYTQNQGYHYRINDGSMTRKLTGDAITYAKRYRKILDNVNKSNQQLRQAIMNVAYDCLKWVIKEYIKQEEYYVDEINFLWNELRYYYENIWYRDNEDYLSMQKWFELPYEDAKCKFSTISSSMIHNIKMFRTQFDKVYIYGTGKVARETIDFLEKLNVEFDGFVVSRFNGQRIMRGKKIYELAEINSADSVGVVLALNSLNAFLVAKNLMEWKNEQILDLSTYRECLVRDTVI